jgi:CubicO group peptidase (beta-lactamase class C family)
MLLATLAVSLLLGHGLHGPGPDTTIIHGPLGARLDSGFTRLAAAGFSGGVLVARGGEVVLARGYGRRNRADDLPYDVHTLVSIGSITKQFTAAAILKLEQEGRLRTTDSLRRFFPAVPDDKAAITLHQLLTHTAGLRSDFAETDYAPVTRDEYVARIFAAPLVSPPGQVNRYSNAGYSLLGMIVEIASGQPYERYLHDHLFVPAGMMETGYRIPAWPAGLAPHGYVQDRDWGTMLDKPWAADGPYWQLRANGGIESTLWDLYRWHLALGSEAVLDAAERKKLFTPWVPEEGGRSYYAYGWAVMKTPRGTTLVTHNGGNRVFVAELQRFVDEGVYVFIASSVAEQTATRWLDWTDATIFGRSAPMPPAVIRQPLARVSALAGRYRLASGEEITLRPLNGQLMAMAGGPATLSLLNGGDTATTDFKRKANARADSLAGAAVRGNYQVVADAFGGRVPVERVAEQEKDLMADRVERLGPFQRYEVMGTTPTPDGDWITHVRMVFERGAVYNRYIWGPGGRLQGIDAGPVGPETPLVALSAERWVSLLPDGSTGVQVQLSPAELVVTHGQQRVTATRVAGTN